MATRYDNDQLAEAQFEPGSRGRVLKNLLGIRRKPKPNSNPPSKPLKNLFWVRRKT